MRMRRPWSNVLNSGGLWRLAINANAAKLGEDGGAILFPLFFATLAQIAQMDRIVIAVVVGTGIKHQNSS